MRRPGSKERELTILGVNEPLCPASRAISERQWGQEVEELRSVIA